MQVAAGVRLPRRQSVSWASELLSLQRHREFSWLILHCSGICDQDSPMIPPCRSSPSYQPPQTPGTPSRGSPCCAAGCAPPPQSSRSLAARHSGLTPALHHISRPCMSHIDMRLLALLVLQGPEQGSTKNADISSREQANQRCLCIMPFQAATHMHGTHLICRPTVKGLKYLRLKSWTISSRSGLTCIMTLMLRCQPSLDSEFARSSCPVCAMWGDVLLPRRRALRAHATTMHRGSTVQQG